MIKHFTFDLECSSFNQQNQKPVHSEFKILINVFPSRRGYLSFQGAYLPTMPQDDLEDIKQAILASKDMSEGAGETIPFYSMCIV